MSLPVCLPVCPLSAARSSSLRLGVASLALQPVSSEQLRALPWDQLQSVIKTWLRDAGILVRAGAVRQNILKVLSDI